MPPSETMRTMTMTFSEPSSSRTKNGIRRLTTSTSCTKVCRYWKSGRCTRRRCPFLHGESSKPVKRSNVRSTLKLPASIPNEGRRCKSKKSPTLLQSPLRRLRREIVKTKDSENKAETALATPSDGARERTSPESSDLEKVVCRGLSPGGSDLENVVCRGFVAGTCNKGESCRNRHVYCISDSFSQLARLEGHSEAVTAIALPSGSNVLFTGSKDKTVKLWDCGTGQCAQVITLEVEVGCIESKGAWVFVGIPNFVKAWNMQIGLDLSLEGPKGQVYALESLDETLFAGAEDGCISVWKSTEEGNFFELAATLRGHQKSVVSLTVSAGNLCSCSMDCTVRVWAVSTLQCMHVLTGHQSVVTSVLCWDAFLLSCSLDKTIKVWVLTETGNIEVTYTHTEEHGVLALRAVHDYQGNPVLLCSCDDNNVLAYDLPSFKDRGTIFSKEEVRALQVGPSDLFFTGDGAGELKVWKWLNNEKSAS